VLTVRIVHESGTASLDYQPRMLLIGNGNVKSKRCKPLILFWKAVAICPWLRPGCGRPSVITMHARQRARAAKLQAVGTLSC